MKAVKSKETKKEKNLRRTLVTEMLRLATGGFGLVAALAWNEVIKETVTNYIKPFVGKDSGIISLFIYAVVVTILAVTVTFYLSRVLKKD